MAGIVFNLRGLTDHIGTQLDDLVGALKNGDSAEVSRLFDNTINPYLTDLDDLTQTQLENTMNKVLFSFSKTNLEKARSLVAIFTSYVRDHVPGRRYWCPLDLSSPRAATTVAPQAVPLYADEPDAQPLVQTDPLLVVAKVAAVDPFAPSAKKTDEELREELNASIMSLVADFF